MAVRSSSRSELICNAFLHKVDPQGFKPWTKPNSRLQKYSLTVNGKSLIGNR